MPIIVAPAPGEGYQGIPGEPPGTQLANVTAYLGDAVLGVVDDFGARVYLTGIEGWWTGTGSTGEVTQRSADHGGWSNLPYRTPRHPELTVEVDANNYDAATAAIERIIAEVPLRSGTLMVASGSEVLQSTVQQDGDVLVDRSGRPGWAKITIPLVAPDPRRYSVDTVTATTGLPETTGGLSLPIAVPLAVPATTTSGTLTVTNAGNAETPPTFTISGPCPPFTIAHRTSGAALHFAEAIPAGRSLVIATARRLAVMDGVATRTVTGTWFAYAPGDNEVAFSADSYDAGALLISEHRHAYL